MKNLKILILMNVLLLLIFSSLFFIYYFNVYNNPTSYKAKLEQEYVIKNENGSDSIASMILLLEPDENFFYSSYILKDPVYGDLPFHMSGRSHVKGLTITLSTDKIIYNRDANFININNALLKSDAFFISRNLLRYTEGNFPLHKESKYVTIWNSSKNLCLFSRRYKIINCYKYIS